ncbi:hypothetical protein [Chamaesiphon sp. VAR_48_metabat_135_sub]|uniref:hypothetical protein n=1 Tax=Chamaesiphon sp. VAR_48_metabat_135_sub TaxID=2964699 RepID=UPI00286CE1DE|nr:hypothetical protein [Chamaesiphon sp. VAR_48_metabat_135_sub]
MESRHNSGHSRWARAAMKHLAPLNLTDNRPVKLSLITELPTLLHLASRGTRSNYVTY